MGRVLQSGLGQRHQQQKDRDGLDAYARVPATFSVEQLG